MNNPLLNPFDTPPFNHIRHHHFLPAFKTAMDAHQQEIQQIVDNSDPPTFSNVVECLEKSGRLLEEVSSIFFNLHSAESDDDIQRIAKEASPLLSAHSNSISMNDALFGKVKAVYSKRESLDLNPEESMLLKRQYLSFARNGALLDEKDKEKLKDIDKQLAELRLTFGDNLLHDSNDYKLVVENKEDLAGLPENVIEAARLVAEEKGEEGRWVFTLDYPSYIPFMTYAENRSLRETLFKAMGQRSGRDNQWDNREILKTIAQLRLERAQLLGYTTHAHFVLEERMAETPEKVESFLQDLLDAALPAAKREMEELANFARENGFTESFQRWDSPYWSEKLKKSRFNVDDETLRPYFKLDNVVEGIFQTASKLYGISFRERSDIPTYHSEVRVFDVVGEGGDDIGILYVDLFPRQGKRNGAWATTFRNQYRTGGKDHRPRVSIVCNFTRPTPTTPSLLNFREVTTLFHEFGHALHMLLSDCQYAELSGANVYWDFVELPSQIMENWPLQQECLNLFAQHYQSGDTIPAEIVKKLADSASFQEGASTVRQVGLAMLDMAWHCKIPRPEEIGDVYLFEEELLAPLQLLPPVEGSTTSPSFGHIFAGGYSAGYYSYKWAEVLDADAFELFKEKSIFDRETASKFRNNILKRGGSEHPMNLYKRFRGREPLPTALLKRAGLLPTTP